MTENEASAPLPEPALKRIREIVREFKAEGGYEFEAETAPEAFLQQEIKTLLEDLNEALSGVALPEPRLTKEAFHNLRVTVENDWLHTKFTCTAPEGADCRLRCTD